MRTDSPTDEQSLPATLHAQLDTFAQHLRLERGRSEHTVRAYCGDVRSLLVHGLGAEPTVVELVQLTLPVLRSWLAAQAAAGVAPPWRDARRQRAVSRRGPCGPD